MKSTKDSPHRGTISIRSEKWIRASAIIAMIVVSISSAILSFDGLQRLALESRIPENLAFLFPIAVDGTILMGSLAVLMYELFGLRSVFGWFTVLFGTALSVTGNIISVKDAGVIAQVLHGIIPVLLCISLESLLRILRSNIQRTIEHESLRHHDDENYVNVSVGEETNPHEGHGHGEDSTCDFNPERYAHKPAIFDSKELVSSEPTIPVDKDSSPAEDTPKAFEPSLTIPDEAPVEEKIEQQVIASLIPLPKRSEVRDIIAEIPVLPVSSMSAPEVVVKETPVIIKDVPAAQENDTSIATPVVKATSPVKIISPEVTQETRTSTNTNNPPSTQSAKTAATPLSAEEIRSFRVIMRDMGEGIPIYVRLAEVLKVKQSISHRDIRTLLGYDPDKNVNAMYAKAKKHANIS